jgi:hypothetical protein
MSTRLPATEYAMGQGCRMRATAYSLEACYTG